MQQGAGHGKALPLAAGQVAAALMQGRLQAVLAAAEVGQVHLFQCGPKLGLGGIGLCHAQVCFHRALENGGIVGHQRQGTQALGPLQLFHRHTAQRHAAGVTGAAAGQQRRNGALAAAGLTHQRDKAALRDGQGHVLQNGAVLLVPKGNVLQLQGSLFRHGLFAIGGFLCCQQFEDFFCRGSTVHGNVEIAAQQPQRQEEICRQQHDGQRGRQAQLTLGKGGHRTDDAQPGPAVGHQVHQGHRIQLHGQHLHGDLAEALGLGVHLLMLPAIGLIDLQGGQALDVFQKAVAQGGVLAPVFCQQLFGKFLHRHDGHGDERHTAQQDDGRPCVHSHQQHEQGDRGQQAVYQLGQVLGKVGVDLFHAFTGQHDHLAGGGGLGVIGAQTGQLVVNVAAQGALDVLGSLVAHAGCQQGEHKPERHRAQAQQKVLPQHPGGEHARKGRPHQPGDGPHKDHVAQHAQPLERHVGPHKAQGPTVKGEQFFVDQGFFSLSVRSASAPNRRSYSPVKMRSGRALVMARAAAVFSSSVRGWLTGGKCSRMLSISACTCLATQMPRSVI